MFTAIMNFAPPNTKVQAYIKRIMNETVDVSEASMRHAVLEAIKENVEIAAPFDGTW